MKETTQKVDEEDEVMTTTVTTIMTSIMISCD